MTETLDKTDGQLVLESLISCNREAVNKIYRECYPSVRFMVTSNSGNIFDAEDVFHDAITHVIEKARKKTLDLTCSLKTYLYAISYNLWQKQLHRKSKEVALMDDLDLSEESDLDSKINYEKKYELFRNNFELLSPEYQKVLVMYLAKYPMKRITSEMGYANENYAKVKKYMCKEHLKNNIMNDPGFRELAVLGSN